MCSSSKCSPEECCQKEPDPSKPDPSKPEPSTPEPSEPEPSELPATCECKGGSGNDGRNSCGDHINNGVYCYVKLPSSCADAKASTAFTGEHYSYQVCEAAPTPTPPATCECKGGSGNGGRNSCGDHVNNGVYCYVKLPSSCADAKPSDAFTGEHYS